MCNMKLHLFDYFITFFIVLSIFGKITSAFENSRYHRSQYELYKKCMKNKGIPTWKVVDSATNATFYRIYNYQWNKIFEPVSPVAIFVPSSVSDVQATVKCGFKANIQLVPNSGSHSYAGLSLGTNCSIIVDFRLMKSIDINEREESVTVGPGAFVGHVNAKLWKNGGWGIVLGNCMTVAMGGHAIGGGLGYFSALYGLVIDNILEMELVDAQGNALTANPTENTDLWWAMRGVGPGYIGLVTSIKIKMFKAKDLKLTFTQIRYPLKEFKNVMGNFTNWLDWVKENDPTVQSVIFMVNDKYNVPSQPLWPGIEIQLLHMQDPKLQPKSSEKVLKGYPKFFPNAVETITRNPSYIEFVIATGYTPVTTQPIQPTPQTPMSVLRSKLDFLETLTKEIAVTRYFFARSFFVNKHLCSEQLTEVQNVVSEIPNNTNGIMITSEQGTVAAIRSNSTSYVHRNSLFNVRLFFESLKVDDVAAGRKWLKKFMKSTKFMDSGETYQNYPDLELKDYLWRYYGRNLKKLIEIKRHSDPRGYFDSKMSIPTTRRHSRC
ncbi:Xylooligosaccharide oxidase [Pseudolycoriella hygida]|uniref:Xylooligosaccharide oxidase n=1 Tax=Pseudolycoriella hygida TaxID=35572 RepID=A0A9Q0N0X6_9DIPT|nr:Xylooligosaccharide oxidase [Pseudolycoriella hygida]